MFADLSRRLLLRLMKNRAERHSGCRIDVERLRSDPEYASAIRALAQFTLDEELRTLGDIAGYGQVEPAAMTQDGPDTISPSASALILQFRRHAAV